MIDPSLRAIAAIIGKGEEDYAGLWEIPIVLRTIGVENPELAAVLYVKRLLDDGLLGCVWGNPQPDANAPILGNELDRVISDRSFWCEDVPFKGVTAWVFATPAGEQWLDALNSAI